MKRIISVVVAVLLIACLSVSAFATNPITSVPDTDTKDVRVLINSGAATTYKVTIEWESLDFTYNLGGTAEWDPDTHTYTAPSGGTPSWAKDSANVKVTNHSNAAVAVDAKFGTTTTMTTNGVTATVTDGTFNLPTAVGTLVADAPNQTFTVGISGAPTSLNDFTVGTVTVTVSAPTT